MKTFFISFFVLLISFSNATSQCEQCNAALRYDIIQQSSSVYEAANFLSLISEQEFIQYKQNASLGISIPYLADFVQGSATYDEFLTKIRNYLSILQSSWQQSSQYDFKSIRTSPVSYDRWGACMEQCLAKPGIVLFELKDNELIGSYKVKYIPAPNDPNRIKINIRVISENVTKDTVIQLNQNGVAILDFKRQYTGDVSRTSITASVRRSYSEKIESNFAKIPHNKITGIVYTYEVKEYKTAAGDAITTCNVDDILKLTTCGSQNPNVVGSGSSCDHKWFGYFYKVSITAPSGYSFDRDILSDDIIFSGPGGGWNNGNCPVKQFQTLASKPTYKQIKVWAGSIETIISIKMPAVRAVAVSEKTYPFQSPENVARFSINNDKLNHFSIRITLASGAVVIVDSNTPNLDKVVDGSNTIFTVPIG